MVEEKVEVKEERRSFLGPDEKTYYYIVAPNAEDIRGADWNYSKTYTRGIVEGITTSAEMMDILRRRGIIGPEFEQRAAELADNLNEKIIELDGIIGVDEKRRLALEVASAREELFQWNQRLNGPMNNTCEQMSDDARLEYLTGCMVVIEDNTKVWDSYDTFLKEKSQALALQARFEVMLYLQGLNSDFLEQTPEALTMKEVDEEIAEKAAEAMRAAQAVVKEEEAEEEVKKPKIKKKTSTSKKSSKKK